MASDAMRAEFEKEVLRRYPNSNLARSQDGYAHTATHSAVPMTYASIQMLWEVWQAARRTPAAEVAGSSDSSMPVVAWCDLSNPLNNEAFAWPGTLSPASHTSALVLQSDALAAIEAANALLTDCHEIINQLIACHEEPDCPAIKVGREIMARIEAASMSPDLDPPAGGREGVR